MDANKNQCGKAGHNIVGTLIFGESKMYAWVTQWKRKCKHQNEISNIG